MKSMPVVGALLLSVALCSQAFAACDMGLDVWQGLVAVAAASECSACAGECCAPGTRLLCQADLRLRLRLWLPTSRSRRCVICSAARRTFSLAIVAAARATPAA